jgi:DNA-directed RNA polymerase specialized sigma24 family protein
VEFEGEEILDRIRATPNQRQEVIKMMISDTKLKHDIQVYVQKNKGSADEALMVFHDSVIAFTKKVFTDQSFTLSSSYNSYIFGIAKNIWFTRLKVASRMPVMVDAVGTYDELQESDFSRFLFRKEKIDILHKILDRLKNNCKEVLLMWAGGYHMQEIADKLGLTSEGNARKRKFDCYKGLMEWLDENPSLLNELKY